jgi:spore germination protein
MRKQTAMTYFCVVLLVLALGGAAVYNGMQAERYKRTIEYNYQRALNDLDDHVGNIETALDKATYANTITEQNILAAKLIRESGMAQSSLATLPVGDNSLDNVSKFIAQVGDFSLAMANHVSAGQKITPDEFKTMRSLETYSKKLTSDMQNLDLDFTGAQTFHDAMQETAKDFSNFPSLIYDGPFADNVMNQKPKLTEGKATIPQGNAQTLAAQFLGTTQDKLTHVQDTAGNLPTYNFTANNGEIRVCVTKAGGLISCMTNSRKTGDTKLGYDEALKKAQAFLREKGMSNMKESYYAINDNICLINFAYSQDGIICYPDLVKVGVALDNGEIVRYDAAGYIMNHHSRNLLAKLTAQQAQKSVSPNLKVQQCRIALIPTTSKSEKLTYEFLCTGMDNEEILVYINAETGLEQDILILQKSDNGVLTK